MVHVSIGVWKAPSLLFMVAVLVILMRANGSHVFMVTLGIKNILYAELIAMLQGLSTAWNINSAKVVCFSDSKHAVDFVNDANSVFHHYAAVISNIMDLLNRLWQAIIHSLCERNQVADFLAKRRAKGWRSASILQLLLADNLGVVFPHV